MFFLSPNTGREGEAVGGRLYLRGDRPFDAIAGGSRIISLVLDMAMEGLEGAKRVVKWPGSGTSVASEATGGSWKMWICRVDAMAVKKQCFSDMTRSTL